MLTIREPIKLNIADGLTTCNDSFYERIVGNYGILSAAITPKDLLFYLSSPPELPDDLGGMTMFTANNSITDKRSISMNVLNNVINRILLSTEDNFTYQDQVYIDSILTKLGISDVSLFMKQVRELSELHSSVKELTNLYHQEFSLRESGGAPEPELKRSSVGPKGDDSRAENESSPVFLHSDIYRRLDTATLYSLVSAYQSRQINYAGAFSKNEIKTAEQLFMSKMLSLSELRTQTAPNAPLTLTHTANHYELGDILPPPRDEEAVLSQAAAASLLSTVEHVITEKLYSKNTGSFWINLGDSLSETIENSISRFRSFHTEGPLMQRFWRENAENTVKQYEKESAVLRELVTMRRELSGIAEKNILTSAEYNAFPQLTLTQENNIYAGESSLSGDTITNLTTGEAGSSSAEAGQQRIFLEKSHELEALIRREGISDVIMPPSPASIEHPASDDAGGPSEQSLSPVEEGKPGENEKALTEKAREILRQASQGNVANDENVKGSLGPEPSGPQAPKSVSGIVPETGIRESVQQSPSASSEYGAFPELTFVQNTETGAGERNPSADIISNFTPVEAGSGSIEAGSERVFLEKSRELEALIRREGVPDAILPPTPADIEHSSPEEDTMPPVQPLSPAEEQKKRAERDRQITEKTREILSRGMPIKNERKATPSLPSIPEPQEAKTVREIELEYGIRERTEKLSALIYKVLPENGQESDEEPSNHETSGSSMPSQVNRVILDRLTASENKITQNIIENAENTFLIKQNSEANGAEKPEPSSYAPIDEEIPPAEISYPVSDSEASPELISRELSEIDRRNRETLSHLRDTRLEKTVEHIPVPDREKTRSLSLRALDSPESVLKEVLETQESAPHSAGKLSPEVQAYLANTDEGTRKLFESILGFEQNPQSQAEGLFHIGNVGELNAVAALQLAQRTPAETDESRVIDDIIHEKLTESRESVLENLRSYPENVQVIENSPAQPPKVPIIHRLEQNGFSEELLERLEQQKTKVSTTQVQNEEVTRNQVHEFTLNDVSQEMGAQSAEDITKLVNQTIAKQMNTISDKVYQQMERRLQTERNRRGRF